MDKNVLVLKQKRENVELNVTPAARPLSRGSISPGKKVCLYVLLYKVKFLSQYY